MPSSHEKATLRRILGLLVSIVLACGICPVTAFAGADNLAAAASSSQDTAGRLLSIQSSSNVKSAKKTTKKSAAFTIKKYREYERYTYTTGEWRYGKPIVKGSSKVAKKINKSLNARYKKHASQTGIVEEAKNADSPRYNRANFHFTVDTKATYNKRGYVSFCYSWDWFGGGVHNAGYFGDVYSLKTGKKLNVSQVVSGNATQVKHKIADAASSQLNRDVYTSYTSRGSAYKQIISKKISEFEFYLQDGKVIVAIEPYTWPGQHSALTVTLNGNYA